MGIVIIKYFHEKKIKPKLKPKLIEKTESPSDMKKENIIKPEIKKNEEKIVP